mgnify:FL=1
MGRMIKIAETNEVGDSNQLYKIGTKWFKSKTHYINTCLLYTSPSPRDA